MRGLLAGWRLARAAFHLAGGLATVLVLFPRWPAQRRRVAVQSWARHMLAALGVRWRVQGGIPAGPLLLACNHHSWLDILVLHAQCFCRFVAKSEVHAWPLVGRMAAAAGTLFIERASRRDALRVVHQMAATLADGGVVAIFPEGTTSPGPLLPFHANLFQAAVSAPAPVLPVALRYLDADRGTVSQAPNFVGDESLSASLWRTVCSPSLVAELRTAPLIVPDAGAMPDRRALARQTQDAVTGLLAPTP